MLLANPISVSHENHGLYFDFSLFKAIMKYIKEYMSFITKKEILSVCLFMIRKNIERSFLRKKNYIDLKNKTTSERAETQ